MGPMRGSLLFLHLQNHYGTTKGLGLNPRWPADDAAGTRERRFNHENLAEGGLYGGSPEGREGYGEAATEVINTQQGVDDEGNKGGVVEGQ